MNYPWSLFQSPNSLSSSPHLKTSAISFFSHLHDNRHRPFHKSLTCPTKHTVSSLSYFKKKKKTTTKHTNTNIAIFFFTVTWKHSLFHHCCVTAESLLSASQILPTAKPEIPLPHHCSEPNKRLLHPNSSVPYTHIDFPSCPHYNSPTCKRKHQVSGSHSHRLSEHWGLFTVLFGSQIQHRMCYGEGRTLPSCHLTSPQPFSDHQGLVSTALH